MAQISDKLSIDILGDEELNKFFTEALTFGKQRSVFITAYRKATKETIKTAKQNLKRLQKGRGTSNLVKSIGVKPSRGKVQLMFGTRTFGNYKGHHGHLFEYGTKHRSYVLNGREYNTGSMPAQPFFEPALESTERNIADVMQDEIKIALHKMVQKNLKRMNIN